MIKNLRLFADIVDNDKKYDLVTVRKYDGVQDGSHSWIFLSYAVVIPKEDNKAVCFRDENVEYEYARKGTAEFCDYSNLKVGDVRIFTSNFNKFDKNGTEKQVEDFIYTSELYFDDDTKYGKTNEKKLIKQ